MYIYTYTTCHSQVVGFHLMDHEGRRDPLCTMYAFMETPPESFFYDFSCGAAATAMNILPEFYESTSFYHDCFHGFAHKCNSVFSARHRTKLYTSYNTSVMEQFNAFAQPLRALLRSGSTKVSHNLQLTPVNGGVHS